MLGASGGGLNDRQSLEREKLNVVIPTFEGHLKRNQDFLKSLKANCSLDSIPPILFITSTDREVEMLNSMLDQDLSELKPLVHMVSLQSDLAEFNNQENDIDSTAAYGPIGFINYKKLAGVDTAFKRSFSHVIVLDSEVLVFRSANFRESLSLAITSERYRFSRKAYENPFIAKIQHDSIRSVDKFYDTSTEFACSYGWYDNLCIYERESFGAFVESMAAKFQGPNSLINAALAFRGFSFDWLVYRSWHRLAFGSEMSDLNLDRIISANGYELARHPQTENIYHYFDGDIERFASLLRAVNPPWVPHTQNEDILSALDIGLSKECCLMFHVDRDHPGARAKPPLSRQLSFGFRAKRKLARVIRRIADRIET